MSTLISQVCSVDRFNRGAVSYFIFDPSDTAHNSHSD
jgi:hypothetical protein